MMSTSAMAGSTTSTRGSLRPDTLGWLTRHDPLRVEGWNDPVVDRLGHDPRSDYVEIFWLPIIGPSCTLAARRLAGWLDAEPTGFDLALGPFARSLGLGGATGRHVPVNRTLARLVDFGMARLGGSTFALRRVFPPLAARQIGRLPPHLAEQHAAHLVADTVTDGRGSVR
jgi:hypothetical protein